ncbi:MAG: hypothetical protein ABSC63_19415 [Candidatus Binataceae bacterium]|jgi:hypothetical protein
MKNRSWIVVILAIGLWTFMPRGVARATTPVGEYVVCSTGVAPYTPTTVGPDSSVEQQVSCNADDFAVGGGVEVLSPSLPLPPGVLVTTPENSFLFTDVTPTGWQVVLQNTNLDPFCALPKPPAKLCPSVQYRVCVSCVGVAS